MKEIIQPEPGTTTMARSTKLSKSAKLAAFDIDAPKLNADIDAAAMGSGNYPYKDKLKREPYEAALKVLQIELVKLQTHIQKSGGRLLVLFEGRDSAGKGGCIGSMLEFMNPRHARSVALSKPTETERGQWYFQRYLAHLPSAGDTVLFDRSWYNRAGVERVMGFANADQVANFLREAPELEEMLVRDGLQFFKIYLTVGREMQLKHFHERRHNPLKQWKLSPIDLAALSRWDDYTAAQHDMFRFTHTSTCQWTVIRANDQRRARIEALRVVHSALDYEGKDAAAIGNVDPQLVGAGPEFFYDE